MPKLLLKKLDKGEPIIEKDVKAAVKRILLRHNLYYFMPVQNGMGAMSVDFLVCAFGKFLAIETKCGKNKPTTRQTLCLESITSSGGISIVINEFNIEELNSLISSLQINNL